VYKARQKELDRQGRVKVADFGLAKIVGFPSDPSHPSDPSMQHATTTEAGQVMGTPQYMAPEQREHPANVDHRADISSLGVVFYQMLTGELPGQTLEPPSKKVLVVRCCR
jgi:serine/threonine protein kinase